jgi:titin
MTLNWNDNSTTETGFQIYKSTDNVTFTLIATTAANTTTYTATGLTDLTTYYWKVVAFNEGTVPTSTSAISQITTLAAPTWVATPITLPTTSGMTLNWIDNSSNETGYQIYSSTDNITFNLVTTTAANTTSYVATGLSTFTVYYWKIAAVSGATTSAFTPVSSLSTLDIAPIAPTWSATPITNPTTTGMTLNWIDNSTNETGFEIYRSTDNITFTKIATTAANAISYTASGLTISTLYYWKVDAVNSGGSSAQTSASSFSTTATSTFTSIATGNWSSGSTWSTGSVPALSDDVIISTGNTVTIDAATNNAKSLTVNGSLIYNATTASALTINGSVTVASGGSFTSPLSGTIVTHSLNIG